MSIQARANAAILAVCPIDGISFGRLDDKSTWRIDFRPEATAPQRTAAQASLAAFDQNAADLPDNAAALTGRQADKALDDMQRAMDQGDTTGALRFVRQILQERK